MAILLITHNLSIVEKIADRVAVMRYGEIVEEGTIEKYF
jgi:ABC-type dipeptide/oligopeptide/nickel transport system ATPase component